MFGFNRFCYMKNIVWLLFSFWVFLMMLFLEMMEDMEVIIEVLKSFGKGIKWYKENIEFGVKVGMVGFVEECRVGFDCLN